MFVRIDEKIDGNILDIGCGGEGVIGRAYGRQVTGIDIMQEELDEAPDLFEKLMMDAADMSFEDKSFDNVTAFYSLMYMGRDTQRKVAEEIARVLKAGGRFYLWDAKIDNAYPDPFCIDLDIEIKGEIIHTTYGIICDDICQDETYFKALWEEYGLMCIQCTSADAHFKMIFKK